MDALVIRVKLFRAHAEVVSREPCLPRSGAAGDLVGRAALDGLLDGSQFLRRGLKRLLHLLGRVNVIEDQRAVGDDQSLDSLKLQPALFQLTFQKAARRADARAARDDGIDIGRVFHGQAADKLQHRVADGVEIDGKDKTERLIVRKFIVQLPVPHGIDHGDHLLAVARQRPRGIQRISGSGKVKDHNLRSCSLILIASL